MNVLVTGGMGYIGSHTSIQMINAGMTPVLFDSLYNSKPSVLERIEKVSGVRPNFIEGDVRDKALLTETMKQHNIDMWLLISREYNEDPILKTMLPATWLSARRTTILLFALNEQGNVDAYAIAPYKIGNVFTKGWDKKAQPSQWQALNNSR